MFNTPMEALKETVERYDEHVPEPLNRQFPNRLERAEAIKHQMERKKLVTELFLQGMPRTIYKYL